jgi:predicted nucleotidyltransferase
MKSRAINIELNHQRIVLDILREHLPPGVRIWVFGARACGRARRYSDPDLAIDAGRRLTIDERATLREAFDECDLPYKVDIVDWQAISDNFRQIIDQERVALVEAPASGPS